MKKQAHPRDYITPATSCIRIVQEKCFAASGSGKLQDMDTIDIYDEDF